LVQAPALAQVHVLSLQVGPLATPAQSAVAVEVAQPHFFEVVHFLP